MSDIVERLKYCAENGIMDASRAGMAAGYGEAAAEIEKLRAAGEAVVKWWLDEGCLPFDGAPYCMFAMRAALGHNRAAAAALGEKNG